MILAPNHQQPLSGSKSMLLALLCTLFLTNCSALKPATQTDVAPKQKAQPEKSEKDALYLEEIRATKVYDPVSQSWIVVTYGPKEKMDTVQWKMRRPDAQTISNFPSYFQPRPIAPIVPLNPVTPEATGVVGGKRIEKKSTYDVAVVLPFLQGIPETASAGSDAKVSRWATNFYAGLKLAGSVLQQEGVSLRIHAADTKADEQSMVKLLEQPALAKADVIIGPYRRDQIKRTADFAKANNKVVVSPYSAVSKLVEQNPGYVQVNPSLESHCRAQLDHVLKEFAPEELLLVTRNNETELACVSFFQKANQDYAGTTDAKPLRTFTITNPTYAGINIEPQLRGKEQLAIIVPSWADQNFVFFLLRKISDAKTENQKIVVYGMPQWMEYENFEYEFFERLHVRVSNPSYLDPLDEEVKAFRQTYFDTYGTVPDLAAFQGYDLLLYVGRMLQEYGRSFQYYLDQYPSHGMHTRFEFKPALTPGASSTELSDNISYFENVFVHILEFRDFQFQLLR